MEPILLAILVTTIAFWATNLENQLILLAYLHNPKYSFRPVSLGYVGATGMILLDSYGVSRVTLAVPNHWIHYLGLLPITLGVWELLKIGHKSKQIQPKIPLTLRQSQDSEAMILVGVATLASGGDSIIVFTSLFADTRFSADLVIFLTCMVMASGSILLAQWISKKQWISTQLKKLEGFLLPVLLILVGVYILIDTPIDVD